MRSPLQGGLPRTDAMVGAMVEIACDESGFSGTNLLHSTAPIITHASVDLGAEEATGLIAALRSGFRFSPHEFKSGPFLRSPGVGAALQWFLAELNGRAHVHLVDKEYFLVTRIVDLLLTEPSYAAGTRLTQQNRPAALALYRARHAAGDDWTVFLESFVDLGRIKRRPPGRRTTERFFRAHDALTRHRLGAAADAVLDKLDPAHVQAVVTRLDDDDRSIPPPLEPMLPALAETVLFWSAGKRQVLVFHDEQSALTADRLTRLQQVLTPRVEHPLIGTEQPHATQPNTAGADTEHASTARAGTERAGTRQAGTRQASAGPASTGVVGGLPPGVSPLAGLVMVDSRDDPRVQVADLLAAVARRLSRTTYDALLEPLLSPTSLCDRRG